METNDNDREIKLVVWDGDDTLWGGTLMEEGVEGILMSLAQYDLLRKLAEQGTLQSLASRNLSPEAKAALHRFGVDDWFLAAQADLHRPKSAMLRTILEQLNLTRWDEVLFVDNDPYNLAEAKSVYPELQTLQAPTDLGALWERLRKKNPLTEEDRLRVRRYKNDLLRKQEAQAYPGDQLAFLRTCNTKVYLRKAQEHDLTRAADLVRRANRMSALAEPFGLKELEHALERDFLYVAHISDRFGDYGLSAVLVVRDDYGEDQLPIKFIALLVVSCRLQGKGVGSALLGTFFNKFPGTPFYASWTATPYNAGIKGLYEWYGFMVGEKDGMTHARHTFTKPVSLPDWIQVITEEV